uniref:G_PROTEIN_RECEP_F1_2 domain-containing protein n=1 Tax=Steinernema glaseri TaxID=37863 RepID=A0A1I8ACK4_9BILA
MATKKRADTSCPRRWHEWSPKQICCNAPESWCKLSCRWCIFESFLAPVILTATFIRYRAVFVESRIGGIFCEFSLQKTLMRTISEKKKRTSMDEYLHSTAFSITFLRAASQNRSRSADLLDQNQRANCPMSTLLGARAAPGSALGSKNAPNTRHALVIANPINTADPSPLQPLHLPLTSFAKDDDYRSLRPRPGHGLLGALLHRRIAGDRRQRPPPHHNPSHSSGPKQTMARIYLSLRLITAGWFTFVYYDLGPLRHTPPALQLFVFCYALHNLFATFCSMTLSFAYRYLVLVEREKPSFIASKDLKYLALLPHVLVIVATMSYAFGMESHELLLEEVMLHHPSYNLSGHVLFGTDLTRSPHVFGSLILPTLPVFPTFVLAIYFKSKTVSYLRSHRDSMSPLTLSLHEKILKALSVQSMLPFFFLLLPVSAFLVVWSLHLSFPLVEHALFLCISMIAFLNPITTFYFISPYKKVFFRWCLKALERRISVVTPMWLSTSNSIVVQPASHL